MTDADRKKMVKEMTCMRHVRCREHMNTNSAWKGGGGRGQYVSKKPAWGGGGGGAHEHELGLGGWAGVEVE